MNSEVKIIIDSRERNDSIVRRLEALGARIEVVTAPVGDYIISDRVGIERKTVGDLQSSIVSGRLFDQLVRLRQAYPVPFLLIEGDMSEFRLGENVAKGLVAAVCIDYNVNVVTSLSPIETSDLVFYMAKHEQNGNSRALSMKGSARSFTDQDFQEHVVANLPGVGPKLAKSLLLHFKSLKNLANADVASLMKVEKIGKKKAERIHEVLNGDYKELKSGPKP
ncbi:helix-hairpin-helix domain-containing protein [Candidatus Marsarchaeota archaeon]|nr:helix-hairpin-helix domain-containing protein [Candidatus Marsarchaeota archaeon]